MEKLSIPGVILTHISSDTGTHFCDVFLKLMVKLLETKDMKMTKKYLQGDGRLKRFYKKIFSWSEQNVM